MGLFDSGGDLIHVRLRLRDRDARLEARDALQIDRKAVTSDAFVWRHHVRDPEIRRANHANRIREVRRHDPDDVVVAIVKRYCAPDDARVRIEVAMPESVAEDCDLVPAVNLVLEREDSSEGRLHAQNVEEPRRDPLREDFFRLALRRA